MNLVRSMSPRLKVVLVAYFAIIALGIVFLVAGGWGGWVFLGIGALGIAWRFSVEQLRQRLIREERAAKSSETHD